MARVVLTKALTQFTGGEGELELEVSTVRELLRIARRALSRARAASGLGPRGRDRRPDLPGRLARADPAGQRGLPDPADRRRLSARLYLSSGCAAQLEVLAQRLQASEAMRAGPSATARDELQLLIRSSEQLWKRGRRAGDRSAVLVHPDQLRMTLLVHLVQPCKGRCPAACAPRPNVEDDCRYVLSLRGSCAFAACFVRPDRRSLPRRKRSRPRAAASAERSSAASSSSRVDAAIVIHAHAHRIDRRCIPRPSPS